MSTGKGSKEFKWTGDAHEALAAALARMHGTIKSDQQAALVKDMNDNGFCTSWEGIRSTYHFHVYFLLRDSRDAYPTLHGINVTMSSPTKGGKKWDERMLSHLFLSIYETLDISFTKEDKDAIVAMMNGRFGHDVNWNGIR
ncbi:hypothetical protein F4825DRAFT_453295 [Nemania diffusa]|nr:hypothetical protein F4825DRAFT_453295 [Nemania diffusa]